MKKATYILLTLLILTGCDASFTTWKDANEDWLIKERKNLEKVEVLDSIEFLESGVIIEKYHTGYGAVPKPTIDPSTQMSSTITVRYSGALIDGTIFDKREKATFELGGTIEGWKEALSIMPQGSHWKIYIPSEKGYGEAGNKGEYSNFTVPPYSTLIFDIDLIDVKNY